MKIFHAMDEQSSVVSKEDKEKMAILKLVDVGKYVKNVGIRDGQFYVIAENNTDEIYLEYKEAVGNINNAMMEKMDFRIMAQKGIEYNTKKANAMKKFMEIPRD
jgi:hypothetical protein